MAHGDLKRNFGRQDRMGALLALLLCPGYVVVLKLRVMLWLYNLGNPAARFAARLLRCHVLRRHGCDVVPSARIGAGLMLPHPVGIVIGEGAVIGRDVTLYQNTTLGRRRADLDGYPKVGDGAVIYAGALLAGPITIGEGATVGGNAVVTHDIPPGGTAMAARPRP